MPEQEPQFDTLPPAIVDALRDLDGPAVLPDAERDAGVLSGARQHLAGQRPKRRQRNLRLFFAGTGGGALAAAAVLGIAFILNDPSADRGDPMEFALQDAMPTIAEDESAIPQATIRLGDVDRNGSVDILDAYALARRLERGQPTDKLDFNADGRTDQRDIDWIANRAVALNPGEPG